jgi:hypothetical protein
MIDEPNRDPEDITREASVTASSSQPPQLEDHETAAAIEHDIAVHLSCDGHVESIELLLEAAPDGADLEIEVWTEDRPENYTPAEHEATKTVTVPGEPAWVTVLVGLDVSGS